MLLGGVVGSGWKWVYSQVSGKKCVHIFKRVKVLVKLSSVYYFLK